MVFVQFYLHVYHVHTCKVSDTCDKAVTFKACVVFVLMVHVITFTYAIKVS